MAKVAGFSFVFIVFLILCADCYRASGQVCCNNHPKIGSCVPGVDDSPDNDGKCWVYCVADCEKGGMCKEIGGGAHVCHCYC